MLSTSIQFPPNRLIRSLIKIRNYLEETRKEWYHLWLTDLNFRWRLLWAWGTVYTDAVSFVTGSLSMRLRLPFTRRRARPWLKPGRFENAVKSGAFWKRYVFIYRVNGETAFTWKRSLISCKKWPTFHSSFLFTDLKTNFVCCAHVTNQKFQLGQYNNNYFSSILTFFLSCLSIYSFSRLESAVTHQLLLVSDVTKSQITLASRIRLKESFKWSLGQRHLVFFDNKNHKIGSV